MANVHTLGNNLKTLRIAAGLTQRQAAALLGIKAPNICRWEKGHTLPEAARLVEVAAIYKTDPNNLLGWRAFKKANLIE